MGRNDTEATRRWTDGKPWEIAWGEFGGKERHGSDDKVDGWETVGNSLGRPVGKERYGSDERVDGREIVGNRLGQSSMGKERDGSDEKVDGRETVGNSLGRGPRGSSDMEATRGWTDGKKWEIAWGELRGEGAIRE